MKIERKKHWQRIFFIASCALCCLSLCSSAEAASRPIRLGIMKFESRADSVSEAQAGAITDIFARMLSNSKSLTVLERERLDAIAREHRLNMSGLVDPSLAVQVGKLAGCQYILIGAVTELSEKESERGSKYQKLRVKGQEAVATIDARIVDVETSQITMTLSGVGRASQATTSRYSKSSNRLNSNYLLAGIEIDLGGLKSQAIAVAASQLGHKVREGLGGEYARIVAIEGSSITINQGASLGVRTGTHYRVLSGNPDQGGRVIAHVEILDVQDQFSIARVIGNESDLRNLQRGDRLEASTQATASDSK